MSQAIADPEDLTRFAAKLGLHRAIFASAEEGRMEKFRPAGLPAPDWLAHALAQLHGKQELRH